MLVVLALYTALSTVLWANDPKSAPATENKAEAKPPTPAAKNEALRKELLERVREDQEFRKKLIELWAQQAEADSESLRDEIEALTKKGVEIDKRNTARMKAIVDQHGWPTTTLVGTDGSNGAWLLVQHADLDPAFQKRCLELLTEANRKGEASGSNLAYLTDRVCLANKEKQVYGTQFQRVEGKLVPRPIEDEANVDHRRKEVGLPPLAEYLKMAEEDLRPVKKP